MTTNRNLIWFCMLFALPLIFACTSEKKGIVFEQDNERHLFESDKIKLEISNTTGIVVFQKTENALLSMVLAGDVPHYIVVNGVAINQFVIDSKKTKFTEIENNYGPGKCLLIVANANGPSNSVIEKNMSIDIFDAFPESAIINITYRNVNSTPGLTIDKEVNNSFTLDARLINDANGKHDFWILQGGSYIKRPDWILPVTDNFSFDNFQGQQIEKGEVGGGLPALDVWCKESGILIGSLREKPTLISLPARVNADNSLEIGIEYKRDKLEFKNTYETIPMVIAVHDGDYYNGLRTYAKIMARNGFEMLTPVDDAYEPIWCGWGFGPDFTQQQMIEMIPIVKDFGFKVVTVDAGWFYYNGDYEPRDDTFPFGEEGMKNFVQIFHDNGLKIKIWITTDIAGEKIAAEHPEWLLLNKDGETEGFKFLGKQYTPFLCPAVEEVQGYYRKMAGKFIGEWGFDGFKVDQELINGVGKCYAKEHNHKYPEESVEALPEIYKILYEETVQIKPDAIFEVCPCGTFPSFYKMPFYNQPVSSDFNTTWQIRHRGKTIKALMGPFAAFYGDHIERHYTDENFPSMVGVGGILGTMFVSKEEDNADFLRVKYPGYLSPERKSLFTKWLKIYNEHKLSKGEYLNLYDIAYDLPETHTIRKEGILHYAFYADNWDGEIAFRGLDEKTYAIIDYENHKKLGEITGNGMLNLNFESHLLVKAVPIN